MAKFEVPFGCRTFSAVKTSRETECPLPLRTPELKVDKTSVCEFPRQSDPFLSARRQALTSVALSAQVRTSEFQEHPVKIGGSLIPCFC